MNYIILNPHAQLYVLVHRHWSHVRLSNSACLLEASHPSQAFESVFSMLSQALPRVAFYCTFSNKEQNKIQFSPLNSAVFHWARSSMSFSIPISSSYVHLFISLNNSVTLVGRISCKGAKEDNSSSANMSPSWPLNRIKEVLGPIYCVLSSVNSQRSGL